MVVSQTKDGFICQTCSHVGLFLGEHIPVNLSGGSKITRSGDKSCESGTRITLGGKTGFFKNYVLVQTNV